MLPYSRSLAIFCFGYGQKVVIFVVEQRENGMCLIAACFVERMNSVLVQEFSRRISLESQVRTDAFCGFWANRIGTKPRPPRRRMWMKWISKVHTVISNFKSFLADSILGLSHLYFQVYNDKFVFRLNHRFWKPQVPDRLLKAAVDPVSIHVSLNSVWMPVV